MVAWAEIPGDDLGNPHPPSTIKYATSDAGGTLWSLPMTVEARAAQVRDLVLVTSGSFVGMVFVESGDGPYANTFDLRSTKWSGGAWTPSGRPACDEPIGIVHAIGTARVR